MVKARRSSGSIKKVSEGNYKLTVTVGYKPNGDQIRRCKTVTASSDRKADAELQLFIAECSKQPTKSAPLSAMTFRDFVAFWRKEHAELNNALKTQERDNQQLNSRIIPALGHYKLSELTTPIIQIFVNSLRKPGMRMDGKPGRLSDREVEMHYSVIHKILNKAVKWHYLQTNPCSDVDCPRPKYKTVRIYDEPDMAKFLDLVDNLPPDKFKYRLLTQLAFSTGLRRGELIGLTWDQIDFKNKRLHVSQAIAYIISLGLIKKAPKNDGSYRYLDLDDEIVSLLEQQQEFEKAAFAKAGVKWSAASFIITQKKDRKKPMHVNSYYTWLCRFLPKTGLPKTSIHKLRHAFGSYQIANGTDVVTLMELMGHGDMRTTRRYSHALESRKRAVATNSANTRANLRSIAKQQKDAAIAEESE